MGLNARSLLNYVYWTLVEGKTSDQKDELDDLLGLTGAGQVDLTDPSLPEELREALAGVPVPAWYNDAKPSDGSFQSFR